VTERPGAPANPGERPRRVLEVNYLTKTARVGTGSSWAGDLAALEHAYATGGPLTMATARLNSTTGEGISWASPSQRAAIRFQSVASGRRARAYRAVPACNA
jgi:hypothetical protein